MTTSVRQLPHQEYGSAPSVLVVAPDAVARRRVGVILERVGIPVRASCATLDALDGDGSGQLVIFLLPSGDSDADGVRALHKRMPEARILTVLRAPRVKDIRRALDAGADGIVDDDSVAAALAPTIEAIWAGQLAVPRPFRSQVQTLVLSNREKQVLGLVVMGLSNGEIASRMYLAESTVKSHLSSAFSKLGVHSRNEAAAMILDPDSNLGPGIIAITPPSKQFAQS